MTCALQLQMPRDEVSELGCVTLITYDVRYTVTNTQSVEVSELGCVTLFIQTPRELR